MVSVRPRLPLIALLLLAASVLHAQPLSEADTRQLLGRIADARAGASYQTDFREEKTLAVAQKPIVETGTLAFLPPDKFRREVPGKSLTVCNGEVLWLYYPGFQQAEKYSLTSNRALRATFAALSSGLGLQESLLKNYTVTATQTPDGHRLVLVPKSSALRRAATQITIDLDASYSARRMEIVNGTDERSVMTFSNEKKVKLSPSDFEFRPPAGATVTEPLGR